MNDAASVFDRQVMARLVDHLVKDGWFVGENFLDLELCQALRTEVETLACKDALDAAGIGRGRQHSLRRDIRGDNIHWLDNGSQEQRRYLSAMAALQHQLNAELYLGLFEFEAHFAHYPPGAFYKAHLDSFEGRSNRVISTVTYLNSHWQPGDGGEMLIFDPKTQQEIARIPPKSGTFTCFLSETIPHEVLPTRQPRASIAGWFRRNTSFGGLIDPPR
ncbi:2OG-Fe(II) oxygenase [Pistricoccus aurantiacus]|uniref:2OG-Fe(II) oxygenase n=1 Tax=Pistricoccus aurantiacus TaxID=1883414 RepID=UPI003634953D